MKIIKLEELLTLEIKKGKIIYNTDIKIYDKVELNKAIKFLEKNKMI